MRNQQFGVAGLTICVLLAACVVPLSAQRAPIEPAKSFEDIPSLPKSSAEVQQRVGMITDIEGKQVVGDKLTQKVTDRERQWMKDLSAQAAAQAMGSMSMGAGSITPDTGRVMGQIQTTTEELNGKSEKELAAWTETRQQLDDAYARNLQQIDSGFNARKVRGGCYGATPTYTIDCQALEKEWNAAILKAGDTDLGKLVTPYEEYKREMKGIATQAQSVLDQADRVFGGHPPAFARAMEQQLTTISMTALGAANSAENDAVVHVYRKSVAPVLGKTGKPHF